MSNTWWFLYQQKGGEEDWQLEPADKRESVVETLKPAFVTVLDLSSIPQDHDWSKVKYRGPLYFDFDADGDIELACSQFKSFLGKLDDDLKFDLSQARMFASGGKGFHIEIPEACFMPKVPESGITWLPYVYRTIAEAIVVDTMDMRVYTGKRGRMWRTPGVKRENGNYKVPLDLVEALEVTPESYAELISQPRPTPPTSPATLNSKLAMLFNNAREKIVAHMRGAKKRREKANTFLDPWKKANKHPPSIAKLMSGEIVAEGAGFQHLSMQLAIYATSVGMELEEFLRECKGLCETHVSDSRRYNTFAKRQEELARMYRYMDSDSLYEFDVAPLIKLVKPGVPTHDLGTIQTEDPEDAPTPTGPTEGDAGDGETTANVAKPAGDALKGVRKGFFINGEGMWRKLGDIVEPMCRAVVRKVESLYDAEKLEFGGFEFDLVMPDRKPKRSILTHDAFTSSAAIKKFFAANQISFQGGDPEAMALMDVLAEKALRGGRIFTYPREGFFVLNNPTHDSPYPVKVYLTQSEYMCSVPEDDPHYFRLRYKATQATSAYNIDIHNAPDLCEDHIPALRDLFSFSMPDRVADLVGWMVAAHYRAFYLHLFKQFPLLQVWGEAGSGKTKTIEMLARLHWYMSDISIKSCMSCTNFAMDSHASTSTSAPFILDEYKPRELKTIKGRLEKLKDVMKATYVGSDIGERGTINKGPDSHLSIIKSRATAPLLFLSESIEMETAIVERCVTVGLTKELHSRQRSAAFHRLHSDGTALSALGKSLIENGFAINLEGMRDEVNAIVADIESRLPTYEDQNAKRPAPRMIFNRAVIVHALRTLQRILHKEFGEEFDSVIESLITYKRDIPDEETKLTQSLGMSEASKVISRMALMSRDQDRPWELRKNQDYVIDDTWLEIKLERAYDAYRTFCASIHDTPLFDSLDAFLIAMNAYSPVIDRVCAGSVLRVDNSNERIVRFDLRRLSREGVKSFRT